MKPLNITFQHTNQDLLILNKHSHLLMTRSRYIEFYEDFTACQKKSADDNAIFYIIEGGGWIETRNSRVPIQPGYIYFYPADMPQDYKVVYLAGTKKVLITFQLNIFSYKDIFSELNEFRCLKDEINLIPKIRDITVGDIESKHLLLSSLLTLSISPLLQEVQPVIKKQLTKGKNYSILFEYLDNHLSMNLTLEDISNHVGLSISTLSHNIPKRFGFTVKKYIHSNILKYVCFDLINTELRIRDISVKYGFSSEAYFSKWFYQQKGIRPNYYRKTYTDQKAFYPSL